MFIQGDYYRELENPSSFRKLAAAMWNPPNDPHVYGLVDIEVTDALAALKAYNEEHQCRATMTHMVVKAVAKIRDRIAQETGTPLCKIKPAAGVE